MNFWTTPRRKALVIAHRGGALLAAEDSAAAFQAAAAIGADAVETDVRQTVDGHLVRFHDDTLERLCGDPRAVAEIDLATLRQRIPSILTLREALSASRPLGVLLDVKLLDGVALEAIQRWPMSAADCPWLAEPRPHSRRSAIGQDSLSDLSVDRELDDCAVFTRADSDFCSEKRRCPRTTAKGNSRRPPMSLARQGWRGTRIGISKPLTSQGSGETDATHQRGGRFDPDQDREAPEFLPFRRMHFVQLRPRWEPCQLK